ncbi:hypothetical protein L7F22_017209 [Adiantum nelumboides]|nr:hypothetical protein [Adiantum nelumboides]
MNKKNAKQAKDYKDKYYQASKEAKRLTEEASKWYDFQEEIRNLEVERESIVNLLQNYLATALKKQAAYAKRKECSKEDVQANEKTIELIEKMITKAKQVQADHLENIKSSLAARAMQASLSKKVTTQTKELTQPRAEVERLNRAGPADIRKRKEEQRSSASQYLEHSTGGGDVHVMMEVRAARSKRQLSQQQR